MFVTFEGLDFSGKSTQVRLLQERLKAAGRTATVIREPGGTPIGERIRAILLDKRSTGMHQIAELFLFSASRAQLVNDVIRPLLQQGTVVITDRYYDSTTAYQGWGRGIDHAAVQIINKCATGSLVPDLTFFLDVPVTEVERRMQAVSATRDRMESSGMEFYERVRNGYLAIASEEERFVVLNGLNPVHELHERIWTSVQQRLPG
jgi:dTMP kinase